MLPNEIAWSGAMRFIYEARLLKKSRHVCVFGHGRKAQIDLLSDAAQVQSLLHSKHADDGKENENQSIYKHPHGLTSLSLLLRKASFKHAVIQFYAAIFNDVH